MKRLLSTKEVARFLDVNEKMVYSLVSEKGLPATKITGKWLFPQHLVEQWIESNTLNDPDRSAQQPPYHGVLIVVGSNDLLLDRTISLFNRLYPEHIAVFGNIGSMGGLSALKRGLCHIATSHLLQDDENEYNFDYADQELEKMPAVVNFCRRQQGLLVNKSNAAKIDRFQHLGQAGIRIVNRPLGTGTRLLFDRELQRCGIQGQALAGYEIEVATHLQVGLEILAGRADAGPGIQPVAEALGLDFVPLRWERFDLLVRKERFFGKDVQLFLGLLHEQVFRQLAEEFKGYDLEASGKMVFPQT